MDPMTEITPQPHDEEQGPAPDARLSIEYIAPWTAAKWLEEYNRKNRRMRPGHLRKLRDAMAEDRWLFAGDPIRFGRDGDLLDGQHRLQAIVDSGKGQWMLVVRDLDPMVFPMIDTEGAPRTIRDVLDIDGDYEGAATGPLGQMAPWLWRWLNRKMDTTVRPTKAQMLDALKQCPGAEDSLEAGRLCYHFTPPGMMSALHYIFSTVDPEAADEFVERLADAEPDKQYLTLLGELRYRLEKAKEAKTKGYKAVPRVQAAWVIKAFNAYRFDPEAPDHKALAWSAAKEPYPTVSES